MDKSKKNYLDMLKRMEKMDPDSVARESEMSKVRQAMKMMRPDDIEETTADLSQDPNLKDLMLPPMTMSKLMEMLKKADPKSVVRENELIELPDRNIVTREGERIFDDMGNISGMSMSDREAIEALTSMGISLEDAVEAILDPNSVARRDEMLEGAVGATMGGGALGALPMQRPVMREGEMGADRTMNPMDAITSRNAPST